jgi:molecular chaperone DnaK
MASPVLGIDLGTTNSVVAYADQQRVRVLRDEDGRFITPSTVSFLESGATLVGYPARDRRLVDVENTVFSVKRLIGRPYRSAEVRRAAERLPFKLEEGQTGGVVVRIRNETFSLPEISSFILRRLRALAEHAIGQPCVNAVITVPANFNELQRMATRDAGRIAGLNVLRILNEPTAAALAYGYRAQQQQRIAVYDFGGGTFDISILELSGDVIEVVATAGDTHLGGDDLDRALADRMVAEFKTEHGIDLRPHAQQYERITMAAEWIKCQLSELETAEATIKQVAFAHGNALDLRFRLRRSELYELCSPLIGRTFTICEEALRLAGVRPSQLDAVILVGGQTRTPKVREMVSEYFGMQPQYSVDPDLAVAQGAALQGYALSGVPAADHERRSPVRTLAGPGVAPTPLDDLFEDEPTRVGTPKELTQPPPPAARRSETPFDDLPTTISRRGDPDFEPTRVGEVRVPHVSVRPYGAVGTHPATLSGVGANAAAPVMPGSEPITVSSDDFTAGDVLQLVAADVPVRPTLAESPHAKAGVRPLRPPASRSMPPPAPRAAGPVAPSQLDDPDEPELPAVLRSLDDFAPDDLDPSATLMERPRAKAKARLPVPPPPAAAARSEQPAPIDLPQPAASRSSNPRAAAATADITIPATGAPTPIPAPRVQTTQSQFPPPPSIAPLLLDVTPHTLCVETVGGFCEPIIERNAAIPTEQTRVFTTSRDSQVTVSVRVCQGESRRTDENQVLGQIDLLGLRQGRRGEVSIAVTFVIDADGTLNVRAVDEGTGRGQEIQVNLVGAIGGHELERMRARQRGSAG